MNVIRNVWESIVGGWSAEKRASVARSFGIEPPAPGESVKAFLDRLDAAQNARMKRDLEEEHTE